MMTFRKQQSGAVLIIALVILGVTTLLGVAVMQGATVESKMANSNQERQQAFNSAEAALRQAEQMILDIGFNDSDLRPGCSGDTCFTPECGNNGLCFAGTYSAAEQWSCSTVSSATPPPGVWVDDVLDVWNTTLRHTTVNIPGYPAGVVAGKYIIEFRCFTDQIDDDPSAGTVATNSGDVVYRITARGTSRSGRVEAMVQSTLRAPAP